MEYKTLADLYRDLYVDKDKVGRLSFPQVKSSDGWTFDDWAKVEIMGRSRGYWLGSYDGSPITITIFPNDVRDLIEVAYVG
jgi:hypothetical protein